MDTSKEAIASALEVLNQKVAELELSLDVKDNFLAEYKKHITEIAILRSYVQIKNNSEDYDLTVFNLLSSISEE